MSKSDSKLVNARMRAPLGPSIARIEDSPRTLPRALPEQPSLKALAERVLARASRRALPAHTLQDQCAEPRALKEMAAHQRKPEVPQLELLSALLKPAH